MTHNAIEVVTTTNIHRQTHYNVFHSESKQVLPKAVLVCAWWLQFGFVITTSGHVVLVINVFWWPNFQCIATNTSCRWTKSFCVWLQLTSWLTSAVLCVFRSSPSWMPRWPSSTKVLICSGTWNPPWRPWWPRFWPSNLSTCIAGHWSSRANVTCHVFLFLAFSALNRKFSKKKRTGEHTPAGPTKG